MFAYFQSGYIARPPSTPPQIREATGSLRFLSPWEYKLSTALQIWPVTLSFCGMIIFNNLCLKFVEITFYQVARSLTIAFNVVFAYVIWGESTSRNAIIACAVVVFGYVLGVDGEINFSWAGVFFGAASSCCLSLYSIFVKKYMAVLNNDSWLLLYYNNVNAMLVMPLISLAFGEYGARARMVPRNTPKLTLMLILKCVFRIYSPIFLSRIVQSRFRSRPTCGRCTRSTCSFSPACSAH
jgi:drug/metabolite transporter (DMT)-like permease